MQIDRASVFKLASFGGVAAVAGACHYFKLGELTGLLGTGLALAGAGAHAGVGHMFVDLVHDVAKRAGGAETARGVQNRDLHRLMGEAIARILEREADRALGKDFGAGYLKRAPPHFAERTGWRSN